MAWLRFFLIPLTANWRQRELHQTSFLASVAFVGWVSIAGAISTATADEDSRQSVSTSPTVSSESGPKIPPGSHLPQRFRRLAKTPEKYVPQTPHLTPELLSQFPNQRREAHQEAQHEAVGSGLRQLDRLMHVTPPELQRDFSEPPVPDRSPTLRQAGRIARRIAHDNAAGNDENFDFVGAETTTIDADGKVIRQVTHAAAGRFPEFHGPARVINFQLREDLSDPFKDESIEDHGAAGDQSDGGHDVAIFDGQEDPMLMGEPPFEMIEPDPEPIVVTVRRSVLMRTGYNIYRTAVVDPAICDLIQFTPREVSIIGREVGSTTATFWFKNSGHRALTYVVNVEPDLQARRALENEYEVLALILTELYPDSKVELLPVADKLIVRGQAKDAQEAAQILQIIRGGTGTRGSSDRSTQPEPDDPTLGGPAASVLSADELGGRMRSGLTLVNMLRVPGPQQIALKVKIAELNRSAARGIGVDVNAEINVSDGASLFIQSMLNGGIGGGAVGNRNRPSVISQFDGDDIQIGVRWLEQEGVIRLLSEPTLVTLSGRPATFVAGGEFAVPTAVGIGGIGAVTTNFRTFGAIISFLPVVIDKDLIRLEVSPEFSQINSTLSNNGSLGLDVRSVTTTVEMREGQTLAIAGLIDDSMNGTKRGDLPILSQIFGRRDTSRNETELIILVTPELIHPMDPDEVPPLPGFDVTEPTNHDFFLRGKLEGNPTQDYRSTVWPRLRHRYQGNDPAMISGPFGHGQ